MLEILWLGMLITGFALLLLSVLLIFIWRIPELVDELSGRKAKRQIKRLKELNIGTGSLDNMSTNDIYSVISDGNLVADEISEKDLEKKYKLDEDASVAEEQNIIDNHVDEDDEDDEGATSDMQSEESKTGYISDATNYMDDEDGETGILEDIREVLASKQNILIIEEQTSIREV